MSEQRIERTAVRPWILPMRARSPDEEHRSATPLELFFDLVFVVAVAQVASSLHHGLAEAHIAESVLHYGIVFFAIWWAWMNFTWFATSYDTDDVPYRLAVFIQLAGALILAAGVEPAFNRLDFRIMVIGYVVMRVVLIGQVLRVARTEPSHRMRSYRYAIGVSAVQVAWVTLLFIPPSWQLAGYVLFMVAELVVPIWADRNGTIAWHPGHIAERYGLFTIIVLGESILAASMAVQSVIQTSEFSGQVATIAAGGLLIVLAMWWLYFDEPMDDLLRSTNLAFLWGYSHLLIFGSVAAVGAGLAVAIDAATHHAKIDTIGAAAAVTIPVALYLVSLWALHPRGEGLSRTLLFFGAALLILLSTVAAQAILLTGLVLAVLVALLQVVRHRREAYDRT